ncbi:formin-like protein 1, partial [Clarias magur]
MGNTSGGMDVSPSRDGKGPQNSFSFGGLKQPPGPKVPLPPEEELEERFSSVL